LLIQERPNSTYSTLVNQTSLAIEFPDEQFESAYQIKHGLDLQNLPINWTSTRVLSSATPITFNYTGLKEKTVYDVYVSLENDFQGLLFNNLSVAKFSAKTLKTISNPLSRSHSTTRHLQHQPGIHLGLTDCDFLYGMINEHSIWSSMR
jgi:hypothetical protein